MNIDNRSGTREEVADWLKISLRTYTDIENNKRQPKYNELIKVAEYLQVPLETHISEQFNVFINGDNSPHGNTGAGQNNTVTITLDQKIMKEMLLLLRTLVDKMGQK